MVTIQQAILTTVSYADIFDFSLTIEELHTWLVYRKTNKRSISKKLTLNVIKRNGSAFVVLSNHRYLVSLRQDRERYAKEKLLKANWCAQWLLFIPSVVLVGVTGALAVSNTKKDDDIDLFIIVAPGTLWITRLFVTVLIELLGLRRHPQTKETSDKICLNMFVTSEALAVPKPEQDLFTAHEVLQMKPLWEKCGMYVQFLEANRWVRRFLPNAWEEKVKSQSASWRTKVKSGNKHIFSILEPMAKALQLWYMRKRRTTEIVSSNVIRFHPRDARIWIKEKLRKRLVLFDVPLDNIFYGR